MKFSTEKHLQEFGKDKFGYENLSKIILDKILLNMELPNCFGLYGNWGSGKSTILHYTIQHLTVNQGDYKKITSIYFEPWKYEYSDRKDLLFALLNCIKEKSKNDNKAWKKIMIDASVIATGMFRKLQLVDVKQVEEDFKLWENHIYKEHESWVNKVEKFKDDFEKIIENVLRENKTSKLFIFIDDLDRCLPENTVKLLEGIKNFLSAKNTLFVLAIDRRIVSEMIEKKYGLHNGYGDEYLMKIVHYYYELPIVNLKDIVEDALSNYEIKFTEKQQNYLVNFLKNEAREPRVAKHVLHQFGMSVELSKNARQELETDSTEQNLQYLFVGSFLLTRFPKLFSGIDSLDLLRNIRDAANAEKGMARPEEYGNIVAKYNINSEIRNKLRAILKNSIKTGRESSPPEFIDVDKLNRMMRILK